MTLFRRKQMATFNRNHPDEKILKYPKKKAIKKNIFKELYWNFWTMHFCPSSQDQDSR